MNISLPPAVDAQGQTLAAENVTSLLSEQKLLPFTYERLNEAGKMETVARLALIADAGRILTEGYLEFQAEAARLQIEAEELKTRANSLDALRAARSKKEKSTALELSGADNSVLVELRRLNHRSDLNTARLLAPAIVEWNVPGLLPTPEVLTAPTGPGRAALDALEAWYFPFSPGSTADSGTSEPANTTTP